MIIDTQTALIDRITAEMATGPDAMLRKVMDTTTFDAAAELAQLAPLVVVTYEGFTPVNQQANGGIVLVDTAWNVIAVVRDARGTLTGAGVRQTVDPILMKLLSFLPGWKPLPTESAHALQLAATPSNGNDDAGFGYYPLSFTLRRTIRGQPNRR